MVLLVLLLIHSYLLQVFNQANLCITASSANDLIIIHLLISFLKILWYELVHAVRRMICTPLSVLMISLISPTFSA